MSFGRRPSSLAPAMNQATCLGTKRSSSSCIARITRLTALTASPASRIWKVCGRFACFQCARRKRLHRPWKVPIHMPRTLKGSIADSRVSISLAALFVKVTAIRLPGETWPVCSSQAMRVVSTRVLPEPAPARISAGSAGSVTAASCSGLRFASRRDSGGSVAGTGEDDGSIAEFYGEPPGRRHRAPPELNEGEERRRSRSRGPGFPCGRATRPGGWRAGCGLRACLPSADPCDRSRTTA